MLNFITRKILGTQNERQLKRLKPLVEKINSYEPHMRRLSDAELRAKTDEFKKIIDERRAASDGRRILDDLLPEAFAVVREAGRRVINMRHFDVQLMGGIVLHQGKIAEMTTGEGKTLVATLAAYLNALLGRGVHIVTVNDYLARRDRDWMGPIYEFLGLSVGVIQHDMSPEERKRQYGCDITYGTNNEFGFDYLRDNMVVDIADMVQRPGSEAGSGFYYAIVDEVDSILIDEARTPLIISGPAEQSTEKYHQINKIVPRLRGRIILEKDQIDAKYKGIDLSEGFDYIVDEKAHTVHLTEQGEVKACEMLGIDNLHEIETMEYRHHIIQALRAHSVLYKKDVNYVVKDGRVIIVDEFTGRMMPGRRWSDGLHQAVEAKEGLRIERENQTLATVTLQNYFRMYDKLAGMTGTAMTEAAEFKAIYKLEAVSIPTNKPLMRAHLPDCIYKTGEAKFNAVVEEITACYEQGRPVLVGTISIDNSERLSEMLRRKGIPHNVLNAKYHELEAHIIAQAGRFKAVTIATNMAGRGTDILLGGNPEHMAQNVIRQQAEAGKKIDLEQEYRKLLDKYKLQADKEHKKVVELGGLHIIGTERHESRRIDNQLRGRAGRQGDPGSSRFYVSLQDDLMRLFGSEKIAFIMEKLGMPEDQAIEHPWINRSIETAQRRVEGHNFEIRKQLLEYDNVMNKQREVIYARRRSILEGRELKQEFLAMAAEMVDNAWQQYIANPVDGNTDIGSFCQSMNDKFSLGVSCDDIDLDNKTEEDVKRDIVCKIEGVYARREQDIGAEHMSELVKMVSLQVIDSKWKDHLYSMDSLRDGIGLRAYGQRDPLVEYQNEAFGMFGAMIDAIRDDSVETVFRVQTRRPQQEMRGVFSSLPQELIHSQARGFRRAQAGPAIAAPHPAAPTGMPTMPPGGPVAKPHSKVGRNAPCPCGSGKKFKRCCGR
ncbi:MAG: preprotein translocase subunit SecA [Candidatus Omnitrophota bacterium]